MPATTYRRAKLATVRRAWHFVKRFYWKAFEDNITGLSAMVAYNLLLSILPLALLALFIAGRVLGSGELERSVLDDLRRLFPDAAESTITSVLDGLQRFSTRLGIAAVVTSIWFGSSFWGALDTAFCRIYHLQCRTWLEQKRFALAMLLVVLVFMAATVLVPTAQSIVLTGAGNLPFGLDRVGGIVYVITLVASLGVLFGILCLIYWAVPKGRLPWAAIWPGSAFATVAIAIIDYAFPLYLDNVSTIASFGTTLVFIAIALLWFYALAIVLLAGATINAMRLASAAPA
jgi:membrane protein